MILTVILSVIGYLAIGILLIRPSGCIANLTEPRVGDVVPTIVFWPFVAFLCLMELRIPKRWRGR